MDQLTIDFHRGIQFLLLPAEFMNQEFGWRSPWYSVAGYTMATGPALLRVMK